MNSLRHARPHLRCGICDEPFEPGEHTTYIDDERVHPDCAVEYLTGGHVGFHRDRDHDDLAEAA